jgi:hypothetical protein
MHHCSGNLVKEKDIYKSSGLIICDIEEICVPNIRIESCDEIN